MTRIVWKLFFYSLYFQWWFNYLERVPILAQKCQFVQKTTNQQSWKSSKVKFWPKPKVQNNAKTKPLNFELLHIWLALYFYHEWRNTLKLHKMSKNPNLKETGLNCGQKYFCSDNPGQNIWHKVKKSSKTRQDLKNLSSNLCVFWQLLSKFNFWKKDGTLGCVSTEIWHFSNIS